MEKYLIVGLGNPGEIYNNTRHQIGMMVLDKYAQNNNLMFRKSSFNADICEIIANNKMITLAKPTTYMNLSGDFVRRFIDFYKIDINNVFVIFDDVSLSLGNYKLKTNSSAGGHNGMKDIINKLNTQSIKRLKIGILDNEMLSKIGLKDFVLSKFNKNELFLINNQMQIYCNIIDDFVKLNFVELCNKYNNKKDVNFK